MSSQSKTIVKAHKRDIARRKNIKRNPSQVPHLRTGALVRIVGYSSQERPHESAAPVTGYNSEVMKTHGY